MRIERRHSSVLVGAILATAMVGICGCQSPRAGGAISSGFYSLHKAMPWRKDDAPKVATPTRLVGAWTDTVLHQPGKKPQRGFGGRLLFYGPKSNDPVCVDGQLAVYAFDETTREPTDNRPTRRYVFPADQVPLHMSMTELGPSYSFWLPWDEVGGPRTEVGLICRFEPKDGALIVSEQTQHVLPGESVAQHGSPKLPEGVPFKPAVHQASYSAVSEPEGGPLMAAGNSRKPVIRSSTRESHSSRQMQTTSISLPDSFRRRGTTATVRAGVPTTSSQPVQKQLKSEERQDMSGDGQSGAGQLDPRSSTLAPRPLPFTPPTPGVSPRLPWGPRSFGSAPLALPVPTPPTSP